MHPSVLFALTFAPAVLLLALFVVLKRRRRLVQGAEPEAMVRTASLNASTVNESGAFRASAQTLLRLIFPDRQCPPVGIQNQRVRQTSAHKLVRCSINTLHLSETDVAYIVHDHQRSLIMTQRSYLHVCHSQPLDVA
jgi:hypothetical protein